MSEVAHVAHDGWAEVVLNRPEVKNAINGPFGLALEAAVREASEDADCSVVLLRGAGGAFCSGLDLKAFNSEPPPEWMADFQHIWRGAHRALFECPVPIVCALERYAINGGAALALAGDILIAGEDSFLQIGEVQQGMAAPYNVAWLNLRTSEVVRAQLALVGRRFAGAELKAMGLAYECVPDANVQSTAQALCESMAQYPAGATRRIKAGLRAHVHMSADEWFDAAVQADPIGTRLSPKRQGG